MMKTRFLGDGEEWCPDFVIVRGNPMARSQFCVRSAGSAIESRCDSTRKPETRAFFLSVFLHPPARLQPQARHVLELQFFFDPRPVGIHGRHSKPEFFSDFARRQ